MSGTNGHWKMLGAIDPKELKDARLELHYAAQLAAVPGACFAAPEDDYGHVSLVWDNDRAVSRPTAGSRKIMGALNFKKIELVILDAEEGAEGMVITNLPLPGETITESLEWLKNDLTGLGYDQTKASINIDRLSDHPLKTGGEFSYDANREAYRELSDYFSNADVVLERVAATNKGSSQIRIWPDHFDIGLVFPAGQALDGEQPVIGAGLSPGDENYDEPYFYAYKWPAPEADTLPEISGGGLWHKSEWFGGVLTASSIVANKDARSQAAQTAEFLESIVSILRTL